ncbi:hypothetical protein BDV24DRAFT_143755, partial [Aspergillus arachidicola]
MYEVCGAVTTSSLTIESICIDLILIAAAVDLKRNSDLNLEHIHFYKISCSEI